MNVWTYEEIDYNRRLHVVTLFIALTIAVCTYPLQVFTSYRLLTIQLTPPIYKLIGIFQFLVHLFTRQFPAFYEFSFLYEFLQKSQMEFLASYLMALSYSVQIHCAFLISLNRFLTFRPISTPWLQAKLIFKLGLLSNLVLPLFFDVFPAIFGDYHYVANPMEDGRIVYRPELPLHKMVSIAPPFLYGAVLSFSSFFMTAYVVYQLIMFRKMKVHLISAVNNSSERGLALTSISTMAVQTVFVVCFLIMLVYKTKEAAAFNIIPLTLNSAAPFWVLLATVPTVRQLLPSISFHKITVEMGVSSTTLTRSPTATNVNG